jgi:hypothetical protein
MRLLRSALALALVCLTGSAQDAPPLDFEQVRAFAAPTERDLVHREVDWLPAVVDGVVAAQQQDRPIVLWLYFGGPLGDC